MRATLFVQQNIYSGYFIIKLEKYFAASIDLLITLNNYPYRHKYEFLN